MTRCRSQWQQMDSEPVIRCARRDGHPGWHYNTRQQRQWETGNRPEAHECRDAYGTDPRVCIECGTVIEDRE